MKDKIWIMEAKALFVRDRAVRHFWSDFISFLRGLIIVREMYVCVADTEEHAESEVRLMMQKYLGHAGYVTVLTKEILTKEIYPKQYKSISGKVKKR